MIRISFADHSDERLIAALQAKGPQIVSGIRVELDRLMFELLRRVQAKLSGEVLQQRSGKLLSSIVKQPTIVSGTGSQIIGGVSGAGGPAWYGRVHEAGGKGWYDIYPVSAKALAFVPSGGLPYATKRGMVFTKHVHHPPLPKRSFMNSSLEEMRSEIVARVYRAAVAAIQT